MGMASGDSDRNRNFVQPAANGSTGWALPDRVLHIGHRLQWSDERKILLEETEQGSDPPAKACPYQSKLGAPSLPKQGQKLSRFFDGLSDGFTVALQI